jgi:hypothetical protein
MPEKIVFIHIPKTAGTSLTRTIDKNYPAQKVRSLYNPETYAIDIPRELKDPDVQVVYGHFVFDSNWLQGADYIFTFLRHPVHRVVSNYLHLRRSSTPVHKEWMKDVENIYGLLDHKQTFNMMTRRLGGFVEIGPFKADLEGARKKAIENMQKMNLIGITEQYEESLLILSKDLGWKHLRQPHHNVSPERDEFNLLVKEAYDAIAEKNALDMEIYEIGKEMLAGRMREINLFDKLNFRIKKLW